MTFAITQSKLSFSRVNSRTHSDANMSPDIEETEEQRVERLGRERPAQFKSVWAEVLFVYSILASQFMAVSQ